MGYENGTLSSMDGAMPHGMGLSINSWYDGSETFYLPEKRIPDVERTKEQAYERTAQEGMKHTTGSIVNAAVSTAGVRLSDTRLASRRAEESGSDHRLFHLSLWY